MPHHRCICSFQACKVDGGRAKIRLPRDEPARSSWLANLCPDNQECSQKDPRVALLHFAPESFVASKVGSGLGGTVVSTRLRDGAKPTLSNDEVTRSAKGALGRSLISQAVVKRHAAALVASTEEIQDLKARIAVLETRTIVLEGRSKEAAKGREEPSHPKIGHMVLIDVKEEPVGRLTGLRSQPSLEVSRDAVMSA